MHGMEFGDPVIFAYCLVVAALLGLVMGSFINCWAWRYLRGESVVRGHSHCTSCGHELGVRDLVPVFSWLFSRGRCRYCGDKVSARYPITELVCAVAFVGIVAVYGLSLQTVELLAFACILLFLSLTDIEEFLIPNGCIIAAIAVRLLYLGVTLAMGTTTLDQIAYYAASAIGAGIALLVIVFVADIIFKRDSMGGGDLKLYFVAGLYFGWQQCLLIVILSCVFGIIVAIMSNRHADEKPSAEGERIVPDGGPDGASDANADSVMKRAIPFGPSIAAACVVVMLVGQPLIDWYLSFL